MTMRARRCLECDKSYDVLSFRECTWAIDHPLLDNPHIPKPMREELIEAGALEVCPDCDSEKFKALASVGRGVMLGGSAGVGKHYPRFDRGLGCEVRSHQHRQEICKRRNLEPVEGASGIIEHVVAREAAEDRAEEEYQAETTELMETADADTKRALDLLDKAKSPDELKEFTKPQAAAVEQQDTSIALGEV